MLLDRKFLLQQAEFQIAKVDLGDDQFVYVREMSGQGRERFERSLLKEVKVKGKSPEFEQDTSDFRAKLSVHTVCNDAGALIFKPGDYGTLSKNMSAVWLSKIVAKAQELNKMSEEDKEKEVKN